MRLFRHLERRAVYLRTPPELRPALGAADERALEFGSSSTVALPPALNAMVTCAQTAAAALASATATTSSAASSAPSAFTTISSSTSTTTTTSTSSTRCAIIGAALCVALALPDASASLFSLTGATGVCLVAYVFPIAAHWALPAAAAGDWRVPPPPPLPLPYSTTVASCPTLSLDTPASVARHPARPHPSYLHQAVHPAASAGVRARLLTALEWGWLGAVLVLGLGVSGVSLLSIVRGWSAHDATVCVEPQGAA